MQPIHRPVHFRLLPPLLVTLFALTACGGGSNTGGLSAIAEIPQVTTGAGAAADPLVGAASSGVKAATTVRADALPTDAVFAPSSFWYQPIPAAVALNPNSQNYVSEFLRQKATYYQTVGLNTWSYASPVYIPAAATTKAPVAFWDCQHKGYVPAGLADAWAAVPVPAYAQAASGSDSEMTIYQPTSDALWEFWQAKSNGTQWSACWGGKMANVSTSSGIWPLPFGATATGLPFIGGQITAEELQRGEIRHVIGIALVDAEQSGIVSWPANRSDGQNPASMPNRIPEGTRFRLDPSVNVDALPIHPVGRIIARAAQKYGFVVWDRAGALTLRMQNPKSYTAMGLPEPYAALFNGTPTYAILNNIPWDRLQFLPKDYGKP